MNPDSMESLAVRYNLASTYRRKRTAEAIELYEHVIAAQSRVIGPDDPQTLSSRNGLALAYLEDGQKEKAIALYKSTLGAGNRSSAATIPERSKA